MQKYQIDREPTYSEKVHFGGFYMLGLTLAVMNWKAY